MATGIVPKLGEPVTCDGPCEHRDCAWVRALVGSPCDMCGEPLKSGQRYYQTDTGNDHAHAVCVELGGR